MKKLLFTITLFVFFVLVQILKGVYLWDETIVVILYLMITFFSKRFKPNFQNIFSPQNIAFTIFFLRLFFLPSLALFFNYSFLDEAYSYNTRWIFQGYLITLLMYLAFVIGWEINAAKSHDIERKKFFLNLKKIKIISIFYLIFGISSLILFFNDINTYLQNIFLSTTDDLTFNNGNQFIGLFANIAKFFLPISVFGFLSLIDVQNKSKIQKFFIIIISFVIVLLFTLNTNRQSIIYPLLALFSGFSTYVRFKPLPTIIVGIISLYFIFSFSNIRSSNEIDFQSSKMDTEELVSHVQVYIGGAQMIAPIFKLEEKRFTVFNTFFYSLPVLGKPLRDNSGLPLYNTLVYGYSGPEDQVFLTQAECFTNGGSILIIVFFVLVGFLYSSLNNLYLSTTDSQFFYRATLYYLILLFNSTILLSFQVMGQFLFFNSLPALIVIYYYNRNSNVVVQLNN